ncbi:MHYT domain-containing protein [Mangrovihabitans endophyticus]|uniref:MHYT domain-containing protein n=1 Tax=Mangrovihabitans endophyticus TaxID=1751298 RepID=UPI0027BAEE26|nr:MHYT domain-containing protein [Mangrovihabitans endophyticus]
MTPGFSYALSVLGSLLGLVCAIRLRNAQNTAGRVWWLSLAAVAIGGTGIWTMHFVAMMGFSVDGTPIRYDVGLTAASALIAVVSVTVGLSIVSFGNRAGSVRIILGGLISGLGVGAMHYTGMAAMRLNGHIEYGIGLVVVSMAIAVVAATVALWLALTVRKATAIVGAALVMGVAVNGMHFTGMAAMSVHRVNANAIGTPSGATASQMLIPIGVAVLFGALGLAYALMAAPTDEDRAAAAYLASRRSPDSSVPQSTGRPAPQASSRPDIPASREAGRQMPTIGASWTYRDRSGR